MKRPTSDRQPVVPGLSRVRGATVLRLASGVALAGFSVALLIAPATGLGAGNQGKSSAQNAKAARTMGLFAPMPVATLTAAIADASPVVEGNPPASPTPTVSPTPVATFAVSLSAPNPHPPPGAAVCTTPRGTGAAR